jgi:hypothetical protein
MLHSNIKLTGRLSIKKYDEKDQLVFETEVPNLVVTAGKEFIANRIVAGTPAVMAYMAIGGDPQLAAVGQTALVKETSRQSIYDTVVSGTNVVFSSLFPAGSGTGNVYEAGIFNTSAANVKTFDGDSAVNATTKIITLTTHGYADGDKVTYVDGGGTTMVGLSDGNVYYVIVLDSNTIQLASTYAKAMAATNVAADNITSGNAIAIGDGSGNNHKLCKGDMLARTTFPIIVKASGETLAIAWTITVG